MFVVGRGEYSDFHILALFEKEEMAQEFIDKFNEQVENYPAEFVEYKWDPKTLVLKWPVFSSPSDALREMKRRRRID